MFYLPCSSLSHPQLTPEEEEKRRIRRERNKLAAAKCRNRRRELTEMLQGVSKQTWRLEPSEQRVFTHKKPQIKSNVLSSVYVCK